MGDRPVHHGLDPSIVTLTQIFTAREICVSIIFVLDLSVPGVTIIVHLPWIKSKFHKYFSLLASDSPLTIALPPFPELQMHKSNNQETITSPCKQNELISHCECIRFAKHSSLFLYPITLKPFTLTDSNQGPRASTHIRTSLCFRLTSYCHSLSPIICDLDKGLQVTP